MQLDVSSITGKIIRGGELMGTGFFINGDHFITAKHNVLKVLEVPTEKEVEILTFSGEHITGKTINLVEAHHKRIDCVIIETKEVITTNNFTKAIRVENDIRGYVFKTYGYPKEQSNGLELGGHIISVSSNRNTDYILSVNKQDTLQSYKGLSGAPIIVNDFIVGVLIQQETSENLIGISFKLIKDILLGERLQDLIKCKRLKNLIIEASMNINQILDYSFFEHHMFQAIKNAGPRYTPEVNVDNETLKHLKFFVQSTSIEEKVQDIIDDITNNVAKMKKYVCGELGSGSDSFKQESKEKIGSTLNILDKAIGILATLFENEKNQLIVHGKLKALYGYIDEVIKQLREVFQEELRLFQDRNGRGTYRNQKWKGFMASNMCIFPTANLEFVEETIEVLLHIKDINLVDPIKLYATSSLILDGRGGIGKTHTLCDLISENFKNGSLGIIFFGQYFGTHSPEHIILERLGVKDISFDELLYKLNIEGEKRDKIVLIGIDALNETIDRGYWNRYLPELFNKIEEYPYVKIITSCRSLYLNEVLEEDILKQVATLSHKGFSGIQHIAVEKYFRYYGLKIPAANKMQQEFSNPLFLKLYCETVRDMAGCDEVIDIKGLSDLLKNLLHMKNKKISMKFSNYMSYKDRIVQKVLSNISVYMNEENTNFIEWPVARKITKGVLDSESIIGIDKIFLDELISENLLKEENGEVFTVSFSFERLFDYMSAKNIINGITDSEDLRKYSFTLIKKAQVYKGPLEILAILYKEKYLRELIGTDNQENLMYEIFLSGLPWRRANNIDIETRKIVEHCINMKDEKLHYNAFFTLFEVALSQGCIINAEYVHSILKSKRMVDRDYFLSYMMLKSNNKFEIVDRILENALRLKQGDVDVEIIQLWELVLTWWTSLNDIYIRDRASKALTNLLRLYPNTIIYLLDKFHEITDDYILERLWQAIYGSIILNKNNNILLQVIENIYENYATKAYPVNILIRDFMRNIAELAYFRGILKYNIEQFRPPYSSEAVLKVKGNKIKVLKEEYRSLYYNCSGSDFVIYTIPSDVEAYGFSKKEVGALIFKEIIKLGYSEKHINHDGYIDYTYGSERNRDESVERIGKKYQKIFLYRILGSIYDNYECDPTNLYINKDTVIPNEQGSQFRDIDLTALPYNTNKHKGFIGKEFYYDFNRVSKLTNQEWFEKEDVQDKIEEVFTVRYDNNDYILLQGYYGNKERRKQKEEYDKREIWFHVRSYLLSQSDEEQLCEWFKGKDFEGRWMPEGVDSLYESWIGEYPWSPYYINALTMVEEGLPEEEQVEVDLEELKQQLAVLLGEYWEEQEESIKEDKEQQVYSNEKDIPVDIIPTVNGFNNEKDTKFCNAEVSNSFLFPSIEFFEKYDLEWDGWNGYAYNNKIVFLVGRGKDTAIYVKKGFLKQFLEGSNQSIVWTVLGEKQVFSKNWSEFLGRGEFSSSYIYQSENVLQNHYLYKSIDEKGNEKKINNSI